jgi:carboxyl-terminal processing protease
MKSLRQLPSFALLPVLATLLAGAPAGCNDASPTPETRKPVALSPQSGSAKDDAGAGTDEGEPEEPKEEFPEGEKNFHKLREVLKEKYYADGLTENDLYRAAVRGMLTLADPSMKKWNALLSPQELREVRTDLKGEVVGIGVKIRFDEASGHSEILGVVPGSPAEKAGIGVGDRIVTVAGKLGKGRSLREVVSLIRGKAGESVSLTVLRDDKLLPFTIERTVVPFDAVEHGILEEKIGYVRVRAFSAKTPQALRDALVALEQANVSELVLDMRGNHGGSFEDALKCAELLVPPGAGIVSVVGRGGKEGALVSKGRPILGQLPIVVLVDQDTSSGGEFVAAAVAESRKAKLVGAKTLGKWSVQTIEDLPNGYAAKFTTHRFQTPSGRHFEGNGMPVDVQVSMDAKVVETLESIREVRERLSMDVQLRTAVSLVRAH